MINNSKQHLGIIIKEFLPQIHWSLVYLTWRNTMLTCIDNTTPRLITKDWEWKSFHHETQKISLIFDSVDQIADMLPNSFIALKKFNSWSYSICVVEQV